MIEQERKLLIQELHTLKIELDKSNRTQNERTELRFVLKDESNGEHKLFATTGISLKLLVEKKRKTLWQSDSSHQFVHLGKWLAEILKHDSDFHNIPRKIATKIMNLYHYSDLE